MLEATDTVHSVLLLEDDRHFQAVVREILEGSGVETEVVSCIKEAKQSFTEKHYDMLMVDGLLPDGTGIDFIRWVRVSRPEIPIIYVSSFFRDATTYQTLKYELQVDKVLPKQITSDLLAEEIAEVFIKHDLSNVTLIGGKSGRPDEGNEAFERALQEKLDDFEAALQQRIDEVRRSIEAAHHNSNNEIVLLEAIRIVHSLVGTAGSFGHDEISSSLAMVERVLRTAVENPSNLLTEHWDLIVLAVDQLTRIHTLENPDSAQQQDASATLPDEEHPSSS
ncbi:MAG: response regulator [Myxococcales bacterium]|nr:response regulator [Myxococcales bacterium]